MRLDLRDILHEDGAVPFSCELPPEGLDFPSISRFLSPLRAKGRVVNSAGVLTLLGEAGAELLCVCDRCGGEYVRSCRVALDAPLAAELQDEENPDVYLLEDGAADLGEIVTTAFVLGLESKLLCKPGCKGVCPRCGKNLNEGPCDCAPETDPRLAVLEQLLEQE